MLCIFRNREIREIDYNQLGENNRIESFGYDSTATDIVHLLYAVHSHLIN